jgi:RimJ/RimL family protein N-acetyltransferase
MRQWVQSNLDHQDRHGYGLFSVILKSNGELVGDCGLEHMEVDGSPEVEIGYDFRSTYWGQGLATEAAAAVRNYAFQELGLGRVISLIRPDNPASMRVAEKIGMVKEKELLRGSQVYCVYSQSRRSSENRA